MTDNTKPPRGRLFIFEGIDCCGKDTQADLFTARLRETGREVYRCNLPNRATPFGTEIDRLLNDRAMADKPATLKRLLGLAYQADSLDTGVVLEMLLEAGVDVVCVRYVLSSLVYQRDQRLLMPLILDNFERFMPKPTATVFIDVDAEESVARRHARNPGADPEFYEGDAGRMMRLRAGYNDTLALVDEGRLNVYVGDYVFDSKPAGVYLGKLVRIDAEESLFTRDEIHNLICHRVFA